MKLQKLLSSLIELSMKNNRKIDYVNAKILQSKLALINGDLEEAENILNNSLNQAKNQKLDYLEIRIQDEFSKVNGQLLKWKELINKNASILEKIELTDIESYIKEVARTI